jgi:integrase/recombinase XerC
MSGLWRELFRRSLLATNKAPRTIDSYMEAVTLFDRFLEARGMPRRVETIRRNTSKRSSLTCWRDLNRHRRKQVSLAPVGLRWLAEEGEIRETPMRNMKPPAVLEQPVPILSEDELRRFFKAREGRLFEVRRDNAILSLFLDTGMRRSELPGLKETVVDSDLSVALVMGKGRRPRVEKSGHSRAIALLRERFNDRADGSFQGGVWERESG